MQHTAIRFETYAAPQPPDPARMDVVCFIGFIRQRLGAVLPAKLLDGLAQAFGQSRAQLAQPGQLFNRPVPVTSITEFEAIFDADARLEARAVIDSGPLASDLPGSGVAEILSIVIDGIIHDVSLSPLPREAQEAAQRIDAAGLGLEVSVETGPGGAFLRIALPVIHGPGSLAVLPYPTLGFSTTRRARARAMPSVMGQAVRQFFAMGGRKAIVVPMGDPIAYDSPRAVRLSALQKLFAKTEGTSPSRFLDAILLSPTAEPETRYGASQLYGLPDVTFVLFPDLPELVAPPPDMLALRREPLAPLEVFAECLPAPGFTGDASDTPFLAPVLDATGQTYWVGAITQILNLLRAHARDKLLIAALPRAAEGLPQIEVPQSAFLQLAEGWVRSPFSHANPERLMAPDTVLAGHLARLSLVRGTFVSAATLPLTQVYDVEPRMVKTDAPTCRFSADLHNIRLVSDLTTSADLSWTAGPVSRIMAMLLRQARLLGQDIAFEPSGPRLWARIRDVLSGLMQAMLRAGALVGDGPGDAYEVRCDASTMSQQDIDAGVLIAEIWFCPTVPVERINVRLPLTENPGQITGSGGPA